MIFKGCKIKVLVVHFPSILTGFGLRMSDSIDRYWRKVAYVTGNLCSGFRVEPFVSVPRRASG